MSSVLGFVLSRAWGLCQGSDPPKGAEQLLAFIFDEVERRSGLLIANEGVPDRRVVLTRDVLHGTVLPEHHDVSDDGSWLSCVPVQPSNSAATLSSYRRSSSRWTTTVAPLPYFEERGSNSVLS